MDVWFVSQKGHELLLFLKECSPIFGLSSFLFIGCGMRRVGGVSMGVNLSGRQANHSHRCSFEDKN